MNERVFFDIIDLEEKSIRHRSLRTERKTVPRLKWSAVEICPFASLPLLPVIRLPRAPLPVILHKPSLTLTYHLRAQLDASTEQQ